MKKNMISNKEIRKLEFFYFRHANTNADYGDRCKCDVDLSPLGEEQIKLLGKRFAGKQFDVILCSPLIRCVKTAAAVARELEKPVTIEIVPELIENGTLPGYAGVDMEYLKRYYPDIKLCEDKNICGNFKNQNDRQNDKRAKKLAKYLKKRFDYGQRVAIFCHGSFGNHLIPALVEMGKGNYILSLSNASVTKIKLTSDGKQRISFHNDISHLRPLDENYEFDT